jgi:hypothetical protein
MFKWDYLATYLILTHFSDFIQTIFLFACFSITSAHMYMHKHANMKVQVQTKLSLFQSFRQILLFLGLENAGREEDMV